MSLEFGHDAGAPRRARAAVRPLVAAVGDPIAFRVETVTSELVSNVVQHTDGGGTVKAWDPKPDVPLRLEVADGDHRTPMAQEPPTAVGGRGLHIVEELADAWGVEHDHTGKTVWVEFDRDAH